jgi:hypothetical protein
MKSGVNPIYTVEALMITIPVAPAIGRQPKASARTARHRYRRQCQGVIVVTKINIAGMLRKWKRIPASYRYLLTDRGFEVLQVQQIRRSLEGCDRKSRS